MCLSVLFRMASSIQFARRWAEDAKMGASTRMAVDAPWVSVNAA
jgi:hypothetical protein